MDDQNFKKKKRSLFFFLLYLFILISSFITTFETPENTRELMLGRLLSLRFDFKTNVYVFSEFIGLV